MAKERTITFLLGIIITIIALVLLIFPKIILYYSFIFLALILLVNSGIIISIGGILRSKNITKSGYGIGLGGSFLFIGFTILAFQVRNGGWIVRSVISLCFGSIFLIMVILSLHYIKKEPSIEKLEKIKEDREKFETRWTNKKLLGFSLTILILSRIFQFFPLSENLLFVILSSISIFLFWHIGLILLIGSIRHNEETVKIGLSFGLPTWTLILITTIIGGQYYGTKLQMINTLYYSFLIKIMFGEESGTIDSIILAIIFVPFINTYNRNGFYLLFHFTIIVHTFIFGIFVARELYLMKKYYGKRDIPKTDN